MYFSTAVFSDSAARQQRKKLLWALLASLLLHLLLLALLQQAIGTVGTVLPGSAASALLVKLRGADRQQAAVAPDAPAELPTSSVTPPAAVRELAANESEVLAATLGERRLAADVPPYLTQVLNTPQGPWYFSRSELTVPPALQDEPLLLPEDSGGAAPRAGKIVLRVFVGADGSVERVEVESSSLPPAFEKAAVAAFARLRFRPGEIEGVAVTSQTRFEVPLEGFETGSSHSTDRQGVGER